MELFALKYLLLISCALMYLGPIFNGCDAKRKAFRIARIMGVCPNINKKEVYAPIDANVTVKNNISYLNLTIRVVRDFPDNMEMMLELERCKYRETQNNCENYHDIKIPGMCEMLFLKGAWSTYIRALQPSLTCPIKKGYYKTPKPIAFTTEGIPSFILSGRYFYKIAIKIQVPKTKEMLACIYSEGEIVNI